MMLFQDDHSHLVKLSQDMGTWVQEMSQHDNQQEKGLLKKNYRNELLSSSGIREKQILMLEHDPYGYKYIC